MQYPQITDHIKNLLIIKYAKIRWHLIATGTYHVGQVLIRLIKKIKARKIGRPWHYADSIGTVTAGTMYHVQFLAIAHIIGKRHEWEYAGQTGTTPENHVHRNPPKHIHATRPISISSRPK
jgi:hypothetical protein